MTGRKKILNIAETSETKTKKHPSPPQVHLTTVPLSITQMLFREELSHIPSCSQQKHPKRARAMNKSYVSSPLL